MTFAVAPAASALAPATAPHAPSAASGGTSGFASLLDSLGSGKPDPGPHATENRGAGDARRDPTDRKRSAQDAARAPAATGDVAALAAALTLAAAPAGSRAPAALEQAAAGSRPAAEAPALADRRALAGRLGAEAATAVAVDPAPAAVSGLRVAGKRTFLTALDAAGHDGATAAADASQASNAGSPDQQPQPGKPDAGGRSERSASKRDAAPSRPAGPPPPATAPPAAAPPAAAPNAASGATAAIQGAPAGGGAIAPIFARDMPALVASETQSLVRDSPAPAQAGEAAGARNAVREIDLQLNPRDLGAVAMTLRLSGETLSVVIKVGSARAQSAIENERAAIEARLASVDQPLASLTIERSDAAPSDSETSDGAHRDASDPGRRQAESQPFDGERAASGRRDWPAAARGGAGRDSPGDFFL